MAEPKTQTQTPANEAQRPENRNITRRGESQLAREQFAMNPFSIFRRLTEEMDRKSVV